MEPRTCKDCSTEFQMSEFYRYPKRLGAAAYGHYCKLCHTARASKYASDRLRNKDDFSFLAKRLLLSANRRAVIRGMECELTAGWIERKLNAGLCEVTKIPFDVSKRSGRVRSRNPWMPSLDRIENSKGYTESNSRIVVWMYNQAKGEYGDDELATLVKALAAA